MDDRILLLPERDSHETDHVGSPVGEEDVVPVYLGLHGPSQLSDAEVKGDVHIHGIVRGPGPATDGDDEEDEADARRRSSVHESFLT